MDSGKALSAAIWRSAAFFGIKQVKVGHQFTNSQSLTNRPQIK
jgi:hypothetical protein